MISETENYNKLKSFFNDEHHSIKAYVNSRIADAADRNAEDIIQDVALKIFSRVDDLSPINNVAAFVYNSVKNKIIDILRTKKPSSRIDDELETQLIEFTKLFYEKPDNSYSEEMKNELKNAILNLKPVYRNVIIAIDFEGFTYKELSGETGIPEGTLMSRRHRAFSLLFKQLEMLKERIN